MNDHQAEELIQKYLHGKCSPEEADLLNSWYNHRSNSIGDELPEPDYAYWYNQIGNRLPQPTKRIKLWPKIAAAVGLIFLSVGTYYITQIEPDQEKVLQTIAQIAKPGGNKAVLTLSNGNQITLTDAKNGTLAVQGTSEIQKTEDGKVVYNAVGADTESELSYNTITTPAGGVYELVLADGTMVTLDAASSMRFPVAFKGKERRVEITGQAYFKVAHNKERPFKVSSNGQTVEVLGTIFNVNAYAEEGVTRTSLIEGSVKVSKAGNNAVLKPGEQSAVFLNNDKVNVGPAELETALAWKAGMFSFQHADLPTVMRQFARWYNVEVVYEGGIPKVSITGKVFRSANAAQVLEILVKIGIKFKAEGKKIIVLPNK
ncbi:FecR family protein [Pedobacter psychroterrae]|uniref:DUF4974 domain-containing protein n=1 Tax=Pedobacter psychroterrae TaxID=2530453 RepID=A0A4R0NM18_9SPHI|nr:FecR family protein [Pedobacter psychroterrae]TCD00958.1 DUF4974 domain-containing protein [Pedobacter psychroterrae]